jgi:hypothetical protein
VCVMSTFTYIRRATAKLWTTPAFRFSCHGPNGQAGVLWNWPPHRKPWIRKHTAQDRLHVGHRVCYVHIYVCIPIDRAVTFIWLPETALNTGKGRNPNVQGSACSGGTFGGCEEGGAFTGGGCEEGGAFTGGCAANPYPRYGTVPKFPPYGRGTGPSILAKQHPS